VLDSVVIKLEGGTDFDLTVLDYPDEEESKDKDKDREKDRDRDEDRGRKRKREKVKEVIFHLSLRDCSYKEM